MNHYKTMNHKIVLFFFVLLSLGSVSRIHAQTMPFVYDTAVRTIDPYDRDGGYARSLSMGAGGFGMINSDGPVLQGTAVGFQSYISNPFLIDPIDVLTNPAWVSHYNGVASLNINPQFANAAFGITPDFSLGLMLAKKSFPGLSINTTQDTGITKNVPSAYKPQSIGLDNTTYLYGALQLGNIAVGLGVSYVSAGYQDTPPADTIQSIDESLSQFGINAGMLAAISKDLTIDAALTIMFPSYSDNLSLTTTDAKGNSTTNTETYSDSRTILGFNGRAMINTTNNFTLIPMVDFYTMSGSSTDTHPVGTKDTTISTTMPSHTSFDAGLGANYLINDLLLVGGLSLGTYSETLTGTNGSPDLHTTQFIFPRWNLGAEYRIDKRVKIRIGYAVSNGTQNTPSFDLSANGKSIGSISQTIRDPYFSPSLGQDAGLSLGASFLYEKFFLDIAVANVEANSPTVVAQLGFVFGNPPKFP